MLRKVKFSDEFDKGSVCSWFRRVGNPDLVQNNSELIFSIPSANTGDVFLISPQERFGWSNYLSSSINVKFKIIASGIIPVFGWLGQDNKIIFTIDDGKFVIVKNENVILTFPAMPISDTNYYQFSLEVGGDGVIIATLTNGNRIDRLVESKNKIIEPDNYNFVIGCKAVEDIGSPKSIVFDFAECAFFKEE